MLNKIYGRWLASWIERAANNPAYGAGRPFLCSVILDCYWSPYRYLVIDHITRMLNIHMTLRMHLDVFVNGRLPSNWHDREMYHRKFWKLKCEALRRGDLDWGRIPDLDALNLRSLHDENVSRSIR